MTYDHEDGTNAIHQFSLSACQIEDGGFGSSLFNNGMYQEEWWVVEVTFLLLVPVAKRPKKIPSLPFSPNSG